MAPLAPEMPIISRFTFCYPLRVVPQTLPDYSRWRNH